MKYRQLTTQQLEALHEDFAKFLATQKIDVKEWSKIKKEQPDLVEDEINVFSDLVWDNVLSKANYLEHFSATFVNLFKCDKNEIHRIYIKVNKDIDLLEKEGFEWLLSNPSDDAIEFFHGSKKYQSERNIEMFDLIEKGSSISKGELFDFFKKLIS